MTETDEGLQRHHFCIDHVAQFAEHLRGAGVVASLGALRDAAEGDIATAVDLVHRVGSAEACIETAFAAG